MNSLTNYYDDSIAENYNNDPFDIQLRSRDTAIEQLQHCLSDERIEQVLDIGVGTGNTIFSVAKNTIN